MITRFHIQLQEFLPDSFAQALVVLVMLGRLLASLLVGFQLVPVPSCFGTVLRFRTEALLEMFVINIMEHVRTHGGHFC